MYRLCPQTDPGTSEHISLTIIIIIIPINGNPLTGWMESIKVLGIRKMEILWQFSFFHIINTFFCFSPTGFVFRFIVPHRTSLRSDFCGFLFKYFVWCMYGHFRTHNLRMTAWVRMFGLEIMPPPPPQLLFEIFDIWKIVFPVTPFWQAVLLSLQFMVSMMKRICKNGEKGYVCVYAWKYAWKDCLVLWLSNLALECMYEYDSADLQNYSKSTVSLSLWNRRRFSQRQSLITNFNEARN